MCVGPAVVDSLAKGTVGVPCYWFQWDLRRFWSSVVLENTQKILLLDPVKTEFMSSCGRSQKWASRVFFAMPSVDFYTPLVVEIFP